MRKSLLYTIFVILFTSCQVFSNTDIPNEPQKPIDTLSPTPGESDQSKTTPLTPFVVDPSRSFAIPTANESPEELRTWTEQPYRGIDIPLPLDLENLKNAGVLEGLTEEEVNFLIKNGFVVIHSQEPQFNDIARETAITTGQPYYLTIDAAFHALHINFDALLKSLEREALRPQVINLTRATIEEVQSSLTELTNTPLENETRQALAYLFVALKLFDPETTVDPSVAENVDQQIQQIMEAGGKAHSVIFPDFQDDYGAYKPVGHYAGDPELEAYFRGMTWFGRMHFLLKDPENPESVASRVPLITTLALRRAEVDGKAASELWGEIYEILNFVIGPSDDAGPLEYAVLMDKVYGADPSYSDLADDNKWFEFVNQSDQLPAPQINSLFVDSTIDLSPEKGWRFMGQRFTMDGLILQNLIFDKVQPKPDGERRNIPSGLDVMAALGSTPALQTLDHMGSNDFINYQQQMTRMQQIIQSQPENQWLGRFYDGWLYSFLPVLSTKGDSYPTVMQTSAWGYREMNMVLGSWAELKHDTILYTKTPEGAGGGGPPRSNPAPSYIEPNPNAYFRMAYIAGSLAAGLSDRLLTDIQEEDQYFEPLSLGWYINGFNDLAERFSILGDIAVKELNGTPISIEENDAITSCLGRIECLTQKTDYNFPESEMPQLPVIAAVSGSGGNVLEVGVGWVDRIYVVVPMENGQEVAQGGVFSYYEFTQPRDLRLTDDEWRSRLVNVNPPDLPAWAEQFVFSGGKTTPLLAFRIGDIYYVNEEGNKLNLRTQPSTNAEVIVQLQTYDYIEIIDGPIEADGYTWWKVKTWTQEEQTGWVVENAEWYSRSG